MIFYIQNYDNLCAKFLKGREIWVGREGKDGRNWVKDNFKV